MFGIIFLALYVTFASFIGIDVLDGGLEQFFLIGAVFIGYFIIGRFFSRKGLGETFREELLISVVVFLGTVVWGAGLVKGLDILTGIDLVQLANKHCMHIKAMGIITAIITGFALGKCGMIAEDSNEF